MRLNDVHFLPGDDPSGWSVTSSVNNNDTSKFGSFITVTLRGRRRDNSISSTQISVGKNNNDILVQPGPFEHHRQARRCGGHGLLRIGRCAVEAPQTDGPAWERGPRNREYYDLAEVIGLISPRMYEVNHVVKDMDNRQ